MRTGSVSLKELSGQKDVALVIIRLGYLDYLSVPGRHFSLNKISTTNTYTNSNTNTNIDTFFDDLKRPTKAMIDQRSVFLCPKMRNSIAKSPK